MWIFLALLSAFGQALGWALKKKALVYPGLNNLLGLVSFTTATFALFIFWFFTWSGEAIIFTKSFVVTSLIVIVANVLAASALYRILDRSSFSQLMPFMALTTLIIIPLEYFFRGALPNVIQIVGMASIVLGALFFHQKISVRNADYRTILYFFVALACYSFASVFQGIAIVDLGDPLLAAAIFHGGIAIGFFILFLLSQECQSLKDGALTGVWKKILGLMALSGIIIAFLENGPASLALTDAVASEVFALKRAMPIFALLLGIFLFKEKVTVRNTIATLFIVLGSVGVIYFR